MKHILFVIHLANDIVQLLEGKVTFFEAFTIAKELIKNEFNIGNKTDNMKAINDYKKNPDALIEMAKKHLEPPTTTEQ